MNSELAKSVVLVTFGNAALHDRGFDAEASLRSHVVLEGVRSMRFGQRSALPPLAAVVDWYAALKEEGAQRLWLVEQPAAGGAAEATAAADAPVIQADLTTKHELFVPHWHSNRHDEWEVCYRSKRCRNSLAERLSSVASATASLLDALHGAREFAERVDEEGWAQLFDKAATRPSRIARHPKYLPPTGFTRPARKLMSMAAAAWVFGGMGSWSDLGFQSRRQQSEYERVSGALYRAVCQGILAAANAYRADARLP